MFSLRQSNIRTESISSRLSIIVPVRNEELSIEVVLIKLRERLPHAEIIVVDGGSDQTRKVVERIQERDQLIQYFKNAHDRGKGHAIREGLNRSTREFVAQFDADLQFDPQDLEKMLQILLDDKADFICGSRFMPHSIRENQSVPGARSAGNRLISFYASIFVQSKFTDVLAGIKMWKRVITTQFNLRSDRYSYEVELPIKAKRLGYRVMEVAVSTGARQFGSSSVNVLKTGFELLRDIPRFRWQALKETE